MRSAYLTFSALSLAALLCACGGGGGSAGGPSSIPVAPVATPTPTPTPIPTPSGATEATQQYVTASQGGNVSLPSGTTLAIPPNALPNSMAIEVATVPKAIQTPSSTALQPSSPAVYIAFSSPSTTSASSMKRAAAYTRPMGSTATSNVTITLPSSYVTGSSAAAFVTAIVSICSNAGCVQEGPQIQIDGAGNYYLTLASGFFLGNVPQWAQVVISKTEGIYQPGLRYFDPSQGAWTTDFPPPAVHPILLLHGLASSVEDTFSSKMVQQLRANGGYDVVLGYDYNFLDTTNNIAPAVASAVGGYANLDIMAHSEGTLVAMDLVPYLSNTEMDNMILVEGPLNGALVDLGASTATGAVTDARTLFISMVEGMLPGDSGVVLPPGLAALTGIQGAVNGALQDNWFQEFTPGSSVLQGIQSRYAAATNKPVRVVLAAGGTPCNPGPPPSPMCFVTSAYQKIMGQSFPTTPQNDGIIPSASELWSGMTAGSALPIGAKNGVSVIPVFSNADHTMVVNNLDVEGTVISPYIQFQFNNAEGGIYYDTPSVFMKGAASTTRLAIFGDDLNTWWYTGLCCGFSADKTQAPEAADAFSVTAVNFITYTLNTPPTTAINPSTPTDSMPTFTQDFADPHSSPFPGPPLNIWAYPDCTLCTTSSVGGASRSMLVNPPMVSAMVAARRSAHAAHVAGARPFGATTTGKPKNP